MKIALTGNYTLDYFKKIFKKQVSSLFNCEIYTGGYNQFNQEILDFSSELYEFKPDIVFIMLQGDKLFPELYTQKFLTCEERCKRNMIDSICDNLKNLVTLLNERTSANIIINNFYIPFYSPLDILDGKNSLGLKDCITEINLRLGMLSREMTDLYVFDYNGFIGYYGYNEVFEHKAYYLTKSYEKRAYLKYLAREYSRYLYGFKGTAKKCIVLDLDNTLWGGVIGEDGLNGIRLDMDGRGKAYWDFQQTVLEQYKRGILLAVCSKNNYSDAMQAIDNHPYMVLRKEYFSALMINWNDKATNIKRIAEELNIGLDSLVFFDDNPFERELVRNMLPEVTVVEMPEDTSLYAKTLRELPFFAKLKITGEDEKRNDMYRENMLRLEQSKSFTDMNDYLRSLDMEICFSYADDFSMSRIHQLINKTNQFNMTTKRYTLEEVKKFSEDDKNAVIYISLTDKFGDNGIVGVLILELTNNDCVIDTFLLSCRVLGRRVEEMVLDTVISMCSKKSKMNIFASVIPTQKNLAYRDVYAKNGWLTVLESEAQTEYKLDVEGYKYKDMSDIFHVKNNL